MEPQIPLKKESKSLKKEAIFEAAMNIFLEKGYEETRIIDIARSAGIGKGTVYEYFPSKEELFFELFCGKMEEHTRAAEEIRKMEGTPVEKLRAYLDVEFDEKDNPTLEHIRKCRVSVDMLLGNGLGKNTRIAEQVRRMLGLRFEILEEIIREGISGKFFPKQDPHMAAVSALGAICFTFAQYQEIMPQGGFSVPEVDFKMVKEDLFRFILKGLSG